MSSSMTETAMASYRAKVGNRYFKVDEGYDKRVYENDAANYARICVTFVFFYMFMSFHWWGNFEYGIWNTEGFYRYSIIIFCCTIVFVCFMLLSGKIANKKKRMATFLEDRIAELSAAKYEEEERKNQEILYQQKLQTKTTNANRT